MTSSKLAHSDMTGGKGSLVTLYFQLCMPPGTSSLSVGQLSIRRGFVCFSLVVGVSAVCLNLITKVACMSSTHFIKPLLPLRKGKNINKNISCLYCSY